MVKGKAEATEDSRARILARGGAAPGAGQDGRSALRDHPGAGEQLEPGEGRAAPRYTRGSSSGIAGDPRARPARCFRRGRGPPAATTACAPTPPCGARWRRSWGREPWCWPATAGVRSTPPRPPPEGRCLRPTSKRRSSRCKSACWSLRAFPGDPAKEREARKVEEELERKRREVFRCPHAVAEDPGRASRAAPVHARLRPGPLHRVDRDPRRPAVRRRPGDRHRVRALRDAPGPVVGHQKGRDTKEKIYRNFGMPRPEGYRKAMRVMWLAEKFRRPIIAFVDTPGAYPGIDAEERGQAEAIAYNLREMAGLPPADRRDGHRGRGQRGRARASASATASTCSSTRSTR